MPCPTLARDAIVGAIMAGRPVLRRLAAEIAARGDPDEDPEGEGYLFDRIVAGETLKAIAADFGVSAGTLLAWLKAGGRDGPRWRAYQEARELAAFVQSEMAQEVLDQLPNDASLTAPRVSLAQAKAAHLRWRAERANRVDFGQQTPAQTVINIGQLHLDALKAAGGPVALPARASEPVIEGDYEVVEPVKDDIGPLL